MNKDELRHWALRVKEAWQRISLKRFKPGEIFVSPKPIYLGQLAKVDGKKVKGFYGKIFDSAAARRFGARDLDEFSFWGWRSCGIVCLQMILKTLIKDFSKKTMDLIKECLAFDGYCYEDKKTGLKDVGWYHSALCKLAGDHGIRSKSLFLATTRDIIQELLRNHFVIVSVKSKTGGHFWLIFGFKGNQNGKARGFYFHDPYGLDEEGKDKFIDFEEFKKEFNNKLISFWKEG